MSVIIILINVSLGSCNDFAQGEEVTFNKREDSLGGMDTWISDRVTSLAPLEDILSLNLLFRNGLKIFG